MKSYKKLLLAYTALDEKYTGLLSNKAEYEYAVQAARSETEHILKQSDEIRALHENARKLKHDMKNHLMVIASYINGGDYDSARTYTSEIIDKLNKTHSYIETGNSLLNHIMNEKLNLARSKGISVKAEIENLSFSGLESLDFSAVLSNMLDNAIEAEEKEAEQARLIDINISKTRGYESITVKNKIAESVIGKNPALMTAKPNKGNHGMGVAQIKALAEKYGGLCDFYEDRGFFCAAVMFPES